MKRALTKVCVNKNYAKALQIDNECKSYCVVSKAVAMHI